MRSDVAASGEDCGRVRRRGVGDAEEQRGDEQHRGRRERVRGVQRAGGRGDGARGTVGQRGRMTRLDESLRERRCSPLKKSKPSCVSRFLGGRYAEGCSSIRGTCQRDSGRSSRFPISRLQRTVNRLVKVAVGKTFAISKKTWSPFRASGWMRPRNCHPHNFPCRADSALTGCFRFGILRRAWDRTHLRVP